MKFEQLLQQYRIPYKLQGQHHRSRSGWLQLDCPYCSKGAGKFYLGYNAAFGYVNCWQCGWHRLTDTIIELTGMPAAEAMALTGDLRANRPAVVKQEVRGTLEVPAHVGPLAYAHKKYLTERGFDWRKLVDIWKIAGIGIATRLAWRIYIPICLGDNVVSWTTRSIDPNVQARYISASATQEAMNHKFLLYGEEYARHSIIINEGPLGAWAIGPGAVAVCGISYSKDQLLRMAKYPVRAVCFDAEPEAQKRARKLCDDLEVYPGATYNIVLSKKSADEVPKSEIAEMRSRFLD